METRNDEEGGWSFSLSTGHGRLHHETICGSISWEKWSDGEDKSKWHSDATTNKVHCSLSSPRDQHSPPWLKLFNAQPAKVLHSRYSRFVNRYSRLVNSRNIGKDNPKSMMIWIRRWNAIIIIQGSWFSLLTFRHSRYFIKNVFYNTSHDGRSDGEDKARANEAKRAAIATKAATTQD